MESNGVERVGVRLDRKVHHMLVASAVGAAVLLASACGPFGENADEMREGATSLVPPGAHVIGREDGSCIQLADSPSCHSVYFVGPSKALEARVDQARAVAERAGWELEKELRTEGGTFLELSRGGLEADVTLWADFRAVPCRKHPSADCADSVRVLR
jgi:hypothetical protein